ncbi:MAG TPA: hypothetical protein DDZ76_13235 [Xanthomonadales bacterium]|nr:hypothetical protein [Xanthomonadales bacterium]
MSVRNLCSPLAQWLSNPHASRHAAVTPNPHLAAGRMRPILTGLILTGLFVLGLLAGCASSPYRTGYYYPAEHGQGDYYSAPAERSYRDPYYYGYGPYYGGFYHSPYYRSHGFYGHYPYSPYRFHRQRIGLGYGHGYGYNGVGYGPSYGYGYNDGYGYGPSYGLGLHFSVNRHRGGHDRGDDPHRGDHRHDRNPDRDHDRHSPRDRPQPVRVIHHPDGENRHIRRSTPIKHAPDTFRPMTGNMRADRSAPTPEQSRTPRFGAQPLPTTPMAHQAPIRVREGTRFDSGPRRIDTDTRKPRAQRSPDGFGPMTGDRRAGRTLTPADSVRQSGLATRQSVPNPSHQAPIRVREGTRIDPGPRRIDIDGNTHSRQRPEPPKSVPRSAPAPSRPMSDRGEAESEQLR